MRAVEKIGSIRIFDAGGMMGGGSMMAGRNGSAVEPASQEQAGAAA